jgi:hypothetical protein
MNYSHLCSNSSFDMTSLEELDYSLGNCESIMADQDLPINPHTPPNHYDDWDISSQPLYSESLLVDNLWITLKQGKGWLEDFLEAAKKHVQKATANLTKLHCIVLNTPELYSITYAHILPQTTHPWIVSNEKFLYFWLISNSGHRLRDWSTPGVRLWNV